MLLDGGDDDDDEGFGEEEVFSLRGVSDEDDSEMESALAEEETDEDSGNDEARPRSRKPSKSTSKSKKSKGSSSPLPEEEEEEEEEEGRWGRGKNAYYSSNAAQIDSEDEEAQELEEQEALRIQAKARDGMHDDDFGLGEPIEGEVELDEPEYVPFMHAFPWSHSQLAENLWTPCNLPRAAFPKTGRPCFASSNESIRKLSLWPETGMTWPTI